MSPPNVPAYLPYELQHNFIQLTYTIALSTMTLLSVNSSYTVTTLQHVMDNFTSPTYDDINMQSYF